MALTMGSLVKVMTKCVEEQNGITEKSCVEILEKYFYNILLTLKYA